MSQVCRYCGEVESAWQHFPQNSIDGGTYHPFEPADDTGGEPQECVSPSPQMRNKLGLSEPAPSADGRQREIDISNLRFYARMFREYKWETDVLSWTVFEHTLKTIADRLAAPAPVSGEGE